MPSLASFLALPHSILLLFSTSIPAAIATEQREQSWQPNVAANVREMAVLKRSAEVQEMLLQATAPVGIRKMSGDEGEKFFWEYWDFGENDAYRGVPPNLPDIPTVRKRALDGGAGDELANLTKQNLLFPPFLLHEVTPLAAQRRSWWSPKSLFTKRDFQCPSNTRNCSSIERPNICCGMDETCVIVEDTGLGDVGCCPSSDGGNCGGQVSECDADAGYSSCPDDDNGGCCIPNFRCEGIGCITNLGTSVTTTTLPTRTVTASSSTTTTAAAPPSSNSSSSSSRSSSSSVETPTVTTTISQTGSETPVPPDRPNTVETSSSSGASLTTFTTTLSGGGGPAVCPTGFYACSARYDGGCCRVGRDCQSTSCPTPATQTIIISNGVTIIVGSGTTAPPPSGSDASATTTITSTGTVSGANAGVCPGGWFSCAPSDDGGCCPSGYDCGVSCTATASGAEDTVAKQPPSAGTRATVDLRMLLFMTGAMLVSGSVLAI